MLAFSTLTHGTLGIIPLAAGVVNTLRTSTKNLVRELIDYITYSCEPTGIQCSRKTFEECDGHMKSERVINFYSAVNCRRLMVLMVMTLFCLVLLYTILNNRHNRN